MLMSAYLIRTIVIGTLLVMTLMGVLSVHAWMAMRAMVLSVKVSLLSITATRVGILDSALSQFHRCQ